MRVSLGKTFNCLSFKMALLSFSSLYIFEVANALNEKLIYVHTIFFKYAYTTGNFIR